MQSVTKHLVISEVAPAFFKTFGKVNKNHLLDKTNKGEISLEAFDEISNSKKDLVAKQDEYVNFLINKVKDHALMTILKNVDEEKYTELSTAMKNVDAMKHGLMGEFCADLKNVGKFFLDTCDVNPDIIKKVFAVQHRTGYDKIDSE